MSKRRQPSRADEFQTALEPLFAAGLTTDQVRNAVVTTVRVFRQGDGLVWNQAEKVYSALELKRYEDKPMFYALPHHKVGPQEIWLDLPMFGTDEDDWKAVWLEDGIIKRTSVSLKYINMNYRDRKVLESNENVPTHSTS